MTRRRELEKISREILKLKKYFPLAIKAVSGEGNSNAKIMFIGEAPGPNENESGRPFVGRAGKFLDKLLKKIRIKRKNIFITGVVKFYPGKRAPNKKEIKLCLPLTLKQIKIIKPDLIVLMGNVALKSILDKNLDVSKVHGKIFCNERGVFFVTFHPAAAMRFPKVREKTLEDFLILKKSEKKSSVLFFI